MDSADVHIGAGRVYVVMMPAKTVHHVCVDPKTHCMVEENQGSAAQRDANVCEKTRHHCILR